MSHGSQPGRMMDGVRKRSDPTPSHRGFVSVSDALAVRCSRRQRRAIGSFYLKGAAIYALTDARDSRVRYVGKTSGSLEFRLDLHFKSPTNQGMRAWLTEAGRKHVRIVLLEYVERAEWEDAERGWIRWFMDRGRLLNVDPGGKFRDRKGKPLGVKLGQFEPAKSRPVSYGKDTWGRLYRPMEVVGRK